MNSSTISSHIILHDKSRDVSGKIKVTDEIHNIHERKFPSNNDDMETKVVDTFYQFFSSYIETAIFIIHVIFILHYVLVSYLFSKYIFTQVILNNKINYIAKWLKSPIFSFESYKKSLKSKKNNPVSL